MPDEIVEHEAHVVAAFADDPVGTEQLREIAAARQLEGDQSGSSGHHDAVRGEERPERRAAALEEGEQYRRRQRRGHQHDRLDTDRVGDRDQREQQHLAAGGRAIQQARELPGDQDEQRVEGVLGHDRARVGHRRDRDRKHGRPERPRLPHDAAGEQVRGHRRQ